jgi:hypothetical protein
VHTKATTTTTTTTIGEEDKEEQAWDQAQGEQQAQEQEAEGEAAEERVVPALQCSVSALAASAPLPASAMRKATAAGTRTTT